MNDSSSDGERPCIRQPLPLCDPVTNAPQAPAWSLVVLALFAPACSPGADSGQSTESAGPSDAPPWFEEVARERGIDFVHVSRPIQRFWFPEIVGSGCALFDYDGDGDLDAYLVQSGDLSPEATNLPGNKLYRNLGDGRFEDVTAAAGVGDTGYGMGCAVGDVDGDGDPDLYVTNYGPNVLYQNNGDGTFTDITEASGTGHAGWGMSAAFMDFDGDGRLDLFVANYVNWTPTTEMECRSDHRVRIYCGPINFNAPSRDVLFRNEGDGRFRDVSEAAGLGAAFGYGMGVACADYDSDGDIDIFVANDGVANQVWMNDGSGRFVDRALISGCALDRNGRAEAGMGVAPVDIDDDGDTDLFMTHLRNETNTCYVNKNGVFVDRTTRMGIAVATVDFTGFGLGFADFDQDGIKDLYVSNGRVERRLTSYSDERPYAEPDQLFRGRGDLKFEEVLPRGGTSDTYCGSSRGAAFGDVDGDGDIDVLVNHNGSRARLLLNVTASPGHWAMLRVVEATGGEAHGASVRVVAGGQTQHRRVDPAYSYCSSNDPRVHVGLGAATELDEIEVTWADGVHESFGPLKADALHELHRGEGR